MKRFFNKTLIFLILSAIIFVWPLDTAKAAYVWQQVGGDGLGDADNTFIPTLEVWNNAIYAGVGNYVDGARIYRSTDGSSWTKVNNDGFGHVALTSILDFQSFNGRLYASTFDDNIPPAQTAEIWSSADGTNWLQSGNDGLGHAHNTGFYEMTEFNGQLYVGSRNNTDGAEIYRTADGTTWNLVADTAVGFGDPNNTIIWGLYSFGGWIWAGTFNANGAQVWRSTNGADWDIYRDMAPIDPNITAVNHFFELNGLLHWFGIDTNEAATITRRTTEILTEIFIGFTGDPNDKWYSQNTVVSGGLLYGGTRNNVNGGALWYTTDGVNLIQIGQDGFGNVDNYAIYALTFKDYLYVGLSTVNGLKGLEIWRRVGTSDFLIITKTLPDGTRGQYYCTQVKADHGNEPYSFRLTSGELPPGTSMDNEGNICGTPTTLGDYRFQVEASDSSRTPEKVRKMFSIKIIAGASDNAESNPVSTATVLPQTGMDL